MPSTGWPPPRPAAKRGYGSPSPVRSPCPKNFFRRQEVTTEVPLESQNVRGSEQEILRDRCFSTIALDGSLVEV
jgi:hypothetical protein